MTISGVTVTIRVVTVTIRVVTVTIRVVTDSEVGDCNYKSSD